LVTISSKMGLIILLLISYYIKITNE
jgi:hypothetical protein